MEKKQRKNHKNQKKRDVHQDQDLASGVLVIDAWKSMPGASDIFSHCAHISFDAQ